MSSATKCLLAGLFLLAAVSLRAQAPANDHPCDAVPLIASPSSVSESGSTKDATPSGLGVCAPGFNDVWYRFTAETAIHSVTVAYVYAYIFPPTESSYTLEIYSGDCNDLKLKHIYCVEQYYNFSETVYFGEFVPGETYYIRIANPDNQPIAFKIWTDTFNFPAPPNDACADATVLNPDADADCDAPVAGSTYSASSSAVLSCPNCFPSRDVWYQFTATQSTHVVNLNGAEGQELLNVYAFTGDCGKLTPLNRYLEYAYGKGALVLNNLTPGQKCYLRVYSHFYVFAINFNICVTTPPPPPNDICSGAVAITPSDGIGCSEETVGTLYGASASGPDCQGGAVTDVWYQFTATSPSHRLSLTPANNEDPYGFQLYGGDCDNPTPLFCGQGTRTLYPLTVGATYFVRVFSPTYKNFDFRLCVMTLPPPPANDECAAATPLAANADYSCDLQTLGTTLGATSSRPDCAGAGDTHDLWYSFEAGSPSMRLMFDETALIFGDYYQLGFEVYSGDCGQLNSLVCKEMNQIFNQETMLGGLTPGATYFIRVYSLAGSNHEFSLCLQTLPPPPDNQICAQAQILVSEPMPGCAAPLAGNTGGVTDFESTGCSYGKDLWYTFTATHSTHVVQITATQTLFGYGYDWRLEVYKGDCAAAGYQNCYVEPQTVYLNQLEIGQPYFLRWVSPTYGAHTFNICLKHFDPPLNDACAAPYTLYPYEILYSVPGSTAGATVGQPAACFDTGDVWYQFAATQTTQQVVLSNIRTAENAAFSEVSVELLTGDCDHLSSIRCWPKIQYPKGALFIGDLTVDQIYYLRVAQPENIPTLFDIGVIQPPPPPVNDNCAAATVLSAETGKDCSALSGTTQHATPTPALPLLPGAGEGDVWYQFSATQSNYEIRMAGVFDNYGNAGRAAIELYSAACNTFVKEQESTIYYSDAFHLTNLQPGAAYYIRIYPLTGAFISYNICLNAPEKPANDECSGAWPLPVNTDLGCGNIVKIGVLGATPSRPDCAGNTDPNDVWYTFTADAPAYRFHLWGYLGNGPASNLEILQGDCGQLTPFFCRKSPTLSDVFQVDGFTPGATYFVRVWGQPNTTQQWDLCAVALPAPPANDECAGATVLNAATELPCGATVTGTTLGALPSKPGCAADFVRDVWYAFTPTEAFNILEINTLKLYFNEYGVLGYELFAGDCNSGNNLLCEAYASPAVQLVLRDLTPGQPYTLRIYSRNLEAQDFSLCFRSLKPPVNDPCAQATAVIANPNLTCNLVYPGTTAGAGFEGNYSEQDVWYAFTATQSTHFFQLLHIKTLYGEHGKLRFQLFSGACDAPDFIGNYDPELQTQVDGLIPGDTYLIRVSSAGSNSDYAYDLCIKSFPPQQPNYECAGAFPIVPAAGLTCETPVHGSAAEVPAVFGQPYCFTFDGLVMSRSSWYRFTASSPNHVLQVYNIEHVAGSSNASSGFEIGVYTGDCNAPQLVACGLWNNELRLFGLVPGAEYYIVVNSFGGIVYAFDLCLTTYPIPQNDLCANATVLAVSPAETCDASTAGTTFSASPSTDFLPCGSSEGNDVWYTFTATQSAHTIEVTDVTDVFNNAPANFHVELYSGACGDLHNLACRFHMEQNDRFTLGDLTPGEMYRIRLSYNYGDISFNICVSTPPLPPDNDACAGAIQLGVSPDASCATPVSGTTLYATPSPLGDLFYFGDNPPENDVWYAFTATQANQLVTLNSIYGTSLQAYAGVCGALTPIAQQLFLSSGSLALQMTNLIPGETYYVRVSGYDTAWFDICVTSPPAPAYDECAGALSLAVNPGLDCLEENTLSTLGSTPSAPGCAGETVNDVWAKFVPGSASCRLDFQAFSWASISEFGLEIFEGDCVTPVVLVPCVEYAYSSTLTLHNLTPGKTYFLRLYVKPSDLKEFRVCIRDLPASPANDDCANATLIQASSGIACDQRYAGTTLAATQSGLACDGRNTDDVWFKFTATATDHFIELQVTGYPLGNYIFPMGMEVYKGDDCDNLSPVACFDYAVDYYTFVENMIPGDTYFIRVYSIQNDVHNFSICIRTLPPNPANRQCSDAIVLTPSPDMACAQPVTATTAGLKETANPGCYNGTSLWYRFTATHYEHFIRLQNIDYQFGNEQFVGLELYSGNCGVLQNIACSDEHEIYSNQLTPGEEYFIRVSGVYGSAVQLDLCVLTVTQPANDNCDGAILLPVSPTQACLTKVYGNNLGASPSPTYYCYSGGPDVVYAFVATNDVHYVNVSNEHPSASYYNVSFIEAMAGNCTDGLYNIGGCQYFNDFALNNLTPGQTYYLRIGSAPGHYVSFDICITTPQPDVFIGEIYPGSDGCKPTDNEFVDVAFHNAGYSRIPAGAAAFTLTVNGTVYGPVFNDQALEPGYYQYSGSVRFTGVDLSSPGGSQLTASAMLQYDLYEGNNIRSAFFTNAPVVTLYQDADNDGYGNPDITLEGCYPGNGYVLDNTDCDDDNYWVHPAAAEYCNGIDDDCNGLIDGLDPGLAVSPPLGITCPADQVVPNDPGLCSAVVSYTVHTADDCGFALAQTSGLASGETFPVGATLNSFTVTAADGSETSCSFTVTVQKSGDPALLQAYTVIGMKDVFMKNNTLQSGGIGLVEAAKKARLQSGTTVTAPNTFVKAPVLEATGGSQVTNYHPGQVAAALLPAFQANDAPTSNNLSVPNNSAPVTLSLSSYGNVIVGINATVTFSGASTVFIKELTVRDGARVYFAQNTDLLINKGMAVAKNVQFNPGGQAVHCFAKENVSVDRGSELNAHVYTLKDLRLEKASAPAPTKMTGRFVATNVYALEFVHWNWDAADCPNSAMLAERTERHNLPQAEPLGLRLFPNPASDAVRVQFELDDDAQVSLQLLDAAGRVVLAEHFAGLRGNNPVTLQVGRLPEGLYTVQMLTQGERRLAKLVLLRP